MKATTKIQKVIEGLSGKLKPLNSIQEKWAIDNLRMDYAVISRNTTHCLACGHKWKEGLKLAALTINVDCPECGRKLTYNQNHRIDKETTYFAIVTTLKGFQVVRMFYFREYYKKKQSSTFHISEVMQHWICEDGKVESLTKPVQNMSYYYDAWSLYGDLEFRTPSPNHKLRCNIGPYKIYTRKSILPKLIRNGFKGDFHGITPHKLFSMLLNCVQAETLIKTGQLELLQALLKRKDDITRYWKSVKIAMKHKYELTEAITWLDYLKLLEYFGKDLKSPKYICPKNLREEHDKLVNKKMIILNQERRRMEQEKDRKDLEKQRAYQEKYEQEKKKYFELQFINDTFCIEPLKSIDEFWEEAQTLEHCVFSNSYFNKKDSLILSARINDQPIETIEVSLDSFQVIQSRGFKNRISKHHNEIVQLVERNMNLISKAVAS